MRFNLANKMPEPPAREELRVLRRLLSALLIGVAMTAVGACATGHAKKGTDHVRLMVVHLTNDLAPPADVTVYAVTSDGMRVLIGDVRPNDHRVLRIPSDVPAGSTFRLVADRGLGRSIASQPITATTQDLTIDWSLQSNAIWFPE